MKFSEHPKHRQFGEALGTSYYASYRLAQAGIVREVHYPDGKRVHRDDANRILEEGLTPEERRRLREHNAQARRSA